MKKLAILLLALLFLMPAVSAAEQVCAVFFWGQGCPACAEAQPVIEELEEKYPNLDITKYEIYINRDNLEVLEKYYTSYGIPEDKRYIPVVFMGSSYYIGYEPIKTYLEKDIEAINGIGLACPYPGFASVNATGYQGIGDPHKPFEAMSFGVITIAGLLDSINPCAIAVLLILLGALLAIGDRKKALKAGLAFVTSIYIVYFLFGLGLFTAVQLSGFAHYFYKFVGIFAIIVGGLNIKDYIWHTKTMEIPEKWRPTLKKLLNGVTSVPGAFLVGFLVCLFELPCTGGPYLYVLGLLAEKTTQMAAIPILLYYNLLFILPLIIITASLYFGLSTIQKAAEFKEKILKRKFLRQNYLKAASI